MGNKSSIVGIIAIILGAAGLGIGTFSVINFQTVEGPQGPPGQDGNDGTDGIDGTDGQDAPTYANVYYCSSGVEIQNAIDSIGAGSGKIIITQDITLTDTIDIDKGGNVVIEGLYAITVDLGGERTGLNITNTSYCLIRDFKINGSDIIVTNNVSILINEINDNRIKIENVEITSINNEGKGILIESSNVDIIDCYISGFDVCIAGYSTASYLYISGNILLDGSVNCLVISCDNSRITNNYIANPNIANFGFLVHLGDSSNITVSNNIVETYGGYGIILYGSDYSTVSSNVVHSLSPTASKHGIIIFNQGNYNTIIGNSVLGFSTTGSIGYYVWDFNSNYNIFIGNQANDCQSDFQDQSGTAKEYGNSWN